MAATYLDILEFPKSAIADLQIIIEVVARNADGSVDAGFAGTVTLTSTDADAHLPVPFTLTAGTARVPIKLENFGPQSLTATSGGLTTFIGHTTVSARPPGLGFDDLALLPYGDAAKAIGVALKSALAVSTNEVDVSLTNLALSSSPFFAGDALNPLTWTVVRDDTGAAFTVVSVTQVQPTVFRLLVLEQFGSVAVTHTVSSTTLKDQGGNTLIPPTHVDFLGLADVQTTLSPLVQNLSGVQDIANPQNPSQQWFAGTLQLTGSGDYKLESGPTLLRKLILRRLVTTPGDFFHLPAYGVGIRVKEPIPASNLGKLKSKIEQQVLQEPEVKTATASVTLDTNGVLTVKVRAVDAQTGKAIDIGFKSTDAGLVL